MNEGWSVSRYWRLENIRYGTPLGAMWISSCPEGHRHFPPREICPECAAIAYHGLRQTDEAPGTVEAGQFESIVLLAEMASVTESLQ